MRESNFAFPAQNRACVCITSQLYDRRALDTTSPLPLVNSLTHLTYLTATSPRIREILTCDGGLERLVRLLRDFCFSPPPPENPSAIFGLSPPSLPRPPPVPTLNPKSFDRHAAYRFSLAFQCVVNIGVRGSEPIRSRVVQAGTLEVVGCVLEAWLASKGFAVGPSVSASGIPRESREQRQQRRMQQHEQSQREQAQELVRRLALESSQMAAGEDDTTVSNSDAETSVSTDTSANATPSGSGTPTSTVMVPGRERSGTVVARRVWDNEIPPVVTGPTMNRTRTVRGRDINSTATSASTSRPDTETEDDGEPDADGDIEMETSNSQDENMPPSNNHPRRTVGVVSDLPSPAAAAAVGAGVTGASDALDVDLDAHIIINTNVADDGVADGIVALEQNVNDDLAMGAPPGAPGAIDATPRTRTNTLTLNTRNLPRDHHHHHHIHGREELTPRAVLATLPMHHHSPTSLTDNTEGAGPSRILPDTQNARTAGPSQTNVTAPSVSSAPTVTPTPRPSHRHHHHHHPAAEDQGPFREEDVLLSLQLLAYLSKYPHVRQAFYKPRLSFHPATALAQGHTSTNAGTSGPTKDSLNWKKTGAATGPGSQTVIVDPKKDLGFFKSLAGRGKEKLASAAGISNAYSSSSSSTTNTNNSTPAPIGTPRMTNVFSLVERFTFRPSPNESNLPCPPPFLPTQIQYWAGVIMRNACRKDESRGGIRQCANMLCGKWESFPREFAKCRRCRKAKYCGKECQSRAWSEGHRFWCSAREGGDEIDSQTTVTGNQILSGEDGEHLIPGNGSRRQGRDRERERHRSANNSTASSGTTVPVPGPSNTSRGNLSPISTDALSVRQQRLHVPRPSIGGSSNLPSPVSGGVPNALATVLGPGSNSFISSLEQMAGMQSNGPQETPNRPTPSRRRVTGEDGTGANVNFDTFTPDEQATIRNFLQAVGMNEVEAELFTSQGTNQGTQGNLTQEQQRIPEATLLALYNQLSDVTTAGRQPVENEGVDIDIEFRNRLRGRGDSSLLPERIQALNVRDLSQIQDQGIENIGLQETTPLPRRREDDTDEMILG